MPYCGINIKCTLKNRVFNPSLPSDGNMWKPENNNVQFTTKPIYFKPYFIAVLSIKSSDFTRKTFLAVFDIKNEKEF